MFHIYINIAEFRYAISLAGIYIYIVTPTYIVVSDNLCQLTDDNFRLEADFVAGMKCCHQRQYIPKFSEYIIALHCLSYFRDCLKYCVFKR